MSGAMMTGMPLVLSMREWKNGFEVRRGKGKKDGKKLDSCLILC